tara:strand:+ start:5781 stop:6725 length:945 start_codon:yes stop_codon:yes gene_type:complete
MSDNNIKKVVLWGLTLYKDTFSYVHYGFQRAFEHLGYETLWLTQDDDISGIDFSNSLFFTCGICEEGIPLNDSSYYVLHNCHMENYKNIPPENILTLQIYTADNVIIESNPTPFCRGPHNSQPLPTEFGFYGERFLYQPWATDLLPYEIDQEIKKLGTHDVRNESWFVGQPHDTWGEWERICRAHGVSFHSIGGFRDRVATPEENKSLIQQSILAPALQSLQQLEMGYPPCRLWKNISYGKMGITNNPVSNKVFGNKLIYSDNLEELFQQGMKFEQRADKYDIIKELMIEVRDKHTYINRVNSILWMLTQAAEQ